MLHRLLSTEIRYNIQPRDVDSKTSKSRIATQRSEKVKGGGNTVTFQINMGAIFSSQTTQSGTSWDIQKTGLSSCSLFWCCCHVNSRRLPPTFWLAVSNRILQLLHPTFTPFLYSQRSECCCKPIMIKTLGKNSTQLTPRYRRVSPLSEPTDCKCSAAHHGSNRYADGLRLSPLIHAEWLGHYT